jgi:hypothetical protein
MCLALWREADLGMVIRPDMRCSIASYVYLDSRVINQIIFGNTITNLVQLIAVEGYNGDVIQTEFELP